MSAMFPPIDDGADEDEPTGGFDLLAALGITDLVCYLSFHHHF